MMRAGGRAILPLPPRNAMDKDHYLPVGPLTLWSFTELADPRWRFGTEYIQLIQRTDSNFRYQEQMTGNLQPSGWGAFYRREHTSLTLKPGSCSAMFLQVTTNNGFGRCCLW